LVSHVGGTEERKERKGWRKLPNEELHDLSLLFTKHYKGEEMKEHERWAL
jgi:hypothetical protein